MNNIYKIQTDAQNLNAPKKWTERALVRLVEYLLSGEYEKENEILEVVFFAPDKSLRFIYDGHHFLSLTWSKCDMNEGSDEVIYDFEFLTGVDAGFKDGESFIKIMR